MKRLLILGLAGLGLAGCVVAPPHYYNSRVVARAPVDPYQWHTVSVEPVRRDANGKIIENPVPAQPQYAASTTVVSQAPVSTSPAYAEPAYAEPVYSAPPVVYAPYAPAPVVYSYDPFLFPLALGLSFEFGRVWHGGWYRGGRSHHRR